MISRGAGMDDGNGRTDAAARAASDDIAIVGMALKVPGADCVDDFWRNLASGTESIERLDAQALRDAGESAGRMADPNYVPAVARLDGFDRFDAAFFGFGPRDAAILDPQHRKFLEVAWEAMEQAGRVPAHQRGDIGVFAGCGMGSYFWVNICSNPDLVDDVGMFLLRHTGNDKDFLATRVSHVFDLRGPSVNIQTACSTSLVAVHYACEALRTGQCDMALAGGATIELPHGRGYVFKENEILSPDGHCHAFDHRAQGTVFGSGAGAVALRRLSDALADGDPIWAVIRGSAVNNDGAAKAGYLAPSVDGQATAVARAIAAAGITADTIGYVECHGTGTYLGDPIEVAALTEAFRRTTPRTDFCRIGSVKTNIGHLDTAAGVASLIKASLALHHGAIPASLGFEAPNPAIDFETSPFRVNDRLSDWPSDGTPRRAGVNSLGVGGTNAHVILEQAPARAASEEADWPFHVLCLSGKSKAALDANARALATHLRAHPEEPLADVAYTLKTGREGFEHRRVLVAETHDEAAGLLESGDPRRVFDHRRLGAAPDVVFMFPGGGAQYTGMARDLYETEPVFAEWMDRGLTHLQGRLDYDIRALWLPEPDAREAAEATLRKPSVQLPLIMIVEYALARLWMSWGIRPAALIGHSMGENTAAALAGVMGFEDCIDLVLLRGRLFDRVPPGGMLSVPLPLAEVGALIGDGLEIACVNADGLCVVSGPAERLDRLEADLAARDIEAQRVAIDIAAHSRMLDPILPEFRAFLRGLDLRAPEIPFVSNRSGDWITPDEATDPDYWVGQLRHTVRFADGIATLARKPDRVFFEMGPGRALSSLAQMDRGVAPGQVLSALRHPQDDIADDRHLLGTVGRLWAAGVEADWAQVWGEARRNRLVLPTYAFQTERYFIEPGKARHDADEPGLVRAGDIADWGYRPVWQPRLAACDAERLATLGGRTPETWLFFADDTGLADVLAGRLAGAGHTVTIVRPGDSYARLSEAEYRLAPDQGPEGYGHLIRALATDGRVPQRIVHGWLVTGAETFRPGSDFFTRNIEHGLYSLMHLAQALESVERPPHVHVTVLTSGAARVADEPLPSPEKATVAGPAGVIPKELPGLTVATLDILPKAPPARPGFLARLRGARTTEPEAPLADRLIEDLLAEPANTVAAWRGDRRYELLWKPVPLPEPQVGHGAGFRDGGTYLITGGLGGIGLAVARDLARRHRARLVLVSRTRLPERVQWEGFLDTVPEADPTAARIRALREIEALGGAVRVEAADICDIDGMRGVVDRARADFGTIHGVIHAAGTIDDAPLLGKTVQQVERVLAPKLHGLRVLDALFPDGTLDLMVLCSSTSTITRPEGQIDYVAANEYLNAFARARVGGVTRVLSVDWGVWAEVGMAVRALARDAAAPPDWSPAAAPLIDAVAHEAGGAHRARLTLATGRSWVIDEHRTAAGDAVLPGTGFVELALESWLAAGGSLPVEIGGMAFLRALDVADGASRAVETRLIPEGAAMRLEVRGACTVEGREGMVLNASASMSPAGGAEPERLDLAAIRARCSHNSDHTGADGFRSPQETHLALGPRWRVVREARLGQAEGLARLALAEAFRATDRGFVLHPALLDLATGWAVELIPGYTPERLWVPVGYGRISVFRAMPADVLSWVRLRPETDGAAGLAGFDVVLACTDGTPVAEIADFQMQRLAGDAVLGRAALTPADDVVFAAGEARAPTPAERQMRRVLAQGIAPDEGVQALARALRRPETQIAVTPLPLGDLVRLAEPRPETRQGQSFARPQLDADFAAPRTGTETRLAALWEGLLGISPVGINDSFFDLGGHSLLAVRLFAAVKRETGVQFPISVLFEAPTIAALAALIDARGGGEGAPEGAAVVTGVAPALRYAVALNGGGQASRTGRTPFFIVAGMFGNVLNLRHLALQLGDRPVHGLQARGLIGSEAPHETIEAAAADYIAEIRAIRPEGPYLLAGFSGGGITAVEIARQLRAAGAEVALVALLDTPLPVRPALRAADKALMKLADIRRRGPAWLIEWARARWAWEVSRRARARGEDGGAGAEGGFNNRRIEMAFRGAVARYELRPWDGPMVLFRPPLDRHWKVSGGNWVSREREYVFDDNGWRAWAPKLKVIEVPGDHDSMVLMPNVSVLARHLGALIEEADPAARPGTDLFTRTAAE